MLLKLGVAVALIATLTVGIVTWRRDAPLKDYMNAQVSFKYPKDYSEQTKARATKYSEPQIKLGVQSPLSIIELNKEKGAIIAANITKSPFLDTLEKNASRALPVNYPNYSKISTQRIQITGRDIALYKFSYTGKDKQTTLYMSFFIIPSDNDAYYLYVQSTDKSRWQNDTKIIQDSLQLK